jgi:hypothetical protein
VLPGPASVQASKFELAAILEHQTWSRKQIADCIQYEYLTRLCHSQHARGYVHCNATDLVTVGLHLPCVNNSTRREVYRRCGIDHGGCATNSADRAVEEHQEAVAGGLHLSAAEAFDLCPHCLVVFGND